MSKRGGLPHTSGEQIIEVDEEGKVSVVGEGTSSTKRPRRKSGSAISVGKDGAVFIRLPDEAAKEYRETAEWLRSTGVGTQHVDGPVAEAVGAALTGKMRTLARGSVMRSFEKPETKGGAADAT